MANKGKKRWTHKVKMIDSKQNLLSYAARVFPILGSKTAAKKAVESGRLLVNGKKAELSYGVKKGDVITLRGSGIQQARKFDIKLEIVFEDDFLLVVNKPGGIAVNGNRNKTVENALANQNRNNQEADALPRPVAVHRIDVPTSGLVLLAKTKKALIQLSKAFQENRVKKEYIAVVHGKTTEKGMIEEPIEGKEAITHFEQLQSVPSRVFDHLSLLKLRPITGRTHQLRIHLTNKGHLIIGDKMYAAGKRTILGKGMLLAACRLQFTHPINGEPIDIQIKPPAKFEKILQREADRFSMNKTNKN